MIETMPNLPTLVKNNINGMPVTTGAIKYVSGYRTGMAFNIPITKNTTKYIAV